MNSLKQRLILYTIEGYLDDISDESTYNYPFMIKLRTAIRGYMMFHKFNKSEYEKVMKIADTEFMKDMQSIQVDRTIYALELLYLYVDLIPKSKRANLNISDHNLMSAKSELIKDMLKLKYKSTEDYNRVKDIVDSSRIAAKKYFHFIKEYK